MVPSRPSTVLVRVHERSFDISNLCYIHDSHYTSKGEKALYPDVPEQLVMEENRAVFGKTVSLRKHLAQTFSPGSSSSNEAHHNEPIGYSPPTWQNMRKAESRMEDLKLEIKAAQERRSRRHLQKEKQQQQPPQEIELEPGIFVPLRGSAETMKGLQNGNMQDATCWGCSERLSCLLDAAFVLCPECRTLTPTPSSHLQCFDPCSSLARRNLNGGVGLGLVSRRQM